MAKTTTKKKFVPTEAQVQAAAEKKARLNTFIETVSTMTDEEILALKEKINIVNCKGEALSARNTCLLDLQGKEVNKEVTIVGGFEQWKNEAKRTVKKGEKSFLSVLVPCSVNAKDSNNNVIVEDGAAKKRLYFQWVSVFDVSQTEPIAASTPADE